MIDVALAIPALPPGAGAAGHDVVRVHVNGTLVGEVSTGEVSPHLADRDALADELTRSRTARAVVRLVVAACAASARVCAGRSPGGRVSDAPVPPKGADAFARGLRDGLGRREVPHPNGPEVPPGPPEMSSEYLSGYYLGDDLQRLAGAARAEFAGGGA